MTARRQPTDIDPPLTRRTGAIDWVEEASIESFPASDAPAWPEPARAATPAQQFAAPSPTADSMGLAPIAYHEAGHVVVGHLLGLQLLDTDILTDDEGGRGHTHFAHPGSWFQPGRGVLTEREKDLIERVLTTFLAGLAAESRLGKADPDGSGYDLDQSLREWVSYLARTAEERSAALGGFLERAAAMIERNQVWAAIEAVAASLLEHGHLDGLAAAQIVERAPGTPPSEGGVDSRPGC